MRVSARTKRVTRRRVSSVQSYPAPVGGWNAREALAAMKPTEAVTLLNWFPKTTYVESRGGYTSHATGMTGNGKTLAVYNAQAGTSKLFCATASGVYDVSSAGAVGSAAIARTNGKHIYVNFGDGTNQWLIMVNGVDAPAYYDGSTWTAVTGASSPALTGLTTTNINYVLVFKGRLIFIEKNSLSFWYLSAGVAGGALTEFDLSGEASLGGYLVAAASWSMDAGEGIDDHLVLVTSKGQALVYKGTNPSSAATWAKVGTYFIGEPLGNRCLCHYGGDLVVLTQNGAFPLSAALQYGAIDYKYAVSFKIEPEFNSASRSYGSNFGWKAVLYPTQSALIVNVPVAEDGTHYQYVMNTTTKAWTKFTAWDAEDFAVMANQLYFCDGTAVYKAWDGTADNGSNIELYGKTAFSYFGNVSTLKQFKMFRPVLAVNGTLSFLTDIDVDFNDTEITGSATYSVNSGAQWDVSNWDEAFWAAGMTVVKEWTSPDEFEGYAAAGKIKIVTNELTIQWISCDYIYEHGGIFG